MSNFNKNCEISDKNGKIKRHSFIKKITKDILLPFRLKLGILDLLKKKWGPNYRSRKSPWI